MILSDYGSFHVLHNGIPRHLWENSMRPRVVNEATEQISITSKALCEIQVVKLVPPSLPGSINTLILGNNIAEGAKCRVTGSRLAHIVEPQKDSCFNTRTLNHSRRYQVNLRVARCCYGCYAIKRAGKGGHVEWYNMRVVPWNLNGKIASCTH